MTRLSLSRFLAIGAVVAMVAAGCGRQPGYSAWHTFGNSLWRYNDTVVLATDSVRPVRDVVLTVGHSASYPYANIWLEMSYPLGDTITADTLNVRLCDEYGRWYGYGSGVSFQCSDTIVPRHDIRPGDTIRLRHIMRMDTVSGIESIGIAY